MPFPAATLPLLKHRLIFVTGKGGVGKTTISHALGLVAAGRGLRTIIADLHGDEEPLERRIGPNLFRISVDPQRAMEEYLLVKVPGAAGQALRQSRLFSAFAMATPGMRELLCMGKLWELAQSRRRTQDADPYDLVVVDAPSSGHGAAILRTPRTFAEIAHVGPVAGQAEAIAATVADRAFTAVVAVTTPEEMAVNETFQLRDTLRLATDSHELDAVILNARYPDRFTAADVAGLSRALAGRPAQPGRAAIEMALAEHKRATAQLGQEQRLRQAFAERLWVLPFLFEPRLERPQIERLALELGL